MSHVINLSSCFSSKWHTFWPLIWPVSSPLLCLACPLISLNPRQSWGYRSTTNWHVNWSWYHYLQRTPVAVILRSGRLNVDPAAWFSIKHRYRYVQLTILFTRPFESMQRQTLIFNLNSFQHKPDWVTFPILRLSPYAVICSAGHASFYIIVKCSLL